MSIYRQGPTPANTCPRCRESLVESVAAGLRYCEKCGGVFADVEATRRIVSTMDRALLEIGFLAGLGKPRKTHEAREVTCPECLVAMQRMRVEAAACVVDACPAHGTWFDAGELEDVMRAFTRARKRGALPPGAAPVAHNPPFAKVLRADDGAQHARAENTLVEMLTSFLKS